MHERTLKRGQALREARLHKGFTQKEVCDMVEGLSQSNLSCYERGYPQISEEKVKKIFEAMGAMDYYFKTFNILKIQLC